MQNIIRRYPVTLGLIALNVAIFIYQFIQPEPFSSEALVKDGAIYGWLIAVKGEWWRLISGIFLHGGVSHIAINMFSLYIMGRMAEELFSRWDYLIIYLVSGIAGAIASVVMHPEGLSVGASGAIFGVFGAIAGYVLAHRERLGGRFGSFMKEFGSVLLVNLVLGFSIPGIDMSAHIGGLIVGLIGGYVAQRSRAIYIWAAAILIVGLGYIIFSFPNTFAAHGVMY